HITNGLCCAAERSGGREPLAAVGRTDGADHGSRGLCGDVQQYPAACALEQIDAAEQLLRAPRPAAPWVCQPAFGDGFPELLWGADLQLAVELQRPARAERRDLRQLSHPVRDVRAQVL